MLAVVSEPTSAVLLLLLLTCGTSPRQNPSLHPFPQADVHHHHHRSRLPPIHVRLCGGEADVTIR